MSEGHGPSGRPAVPAGLWERPEMAKALAERDMGAVVRIYRKWTGASQTTVGMLIGMPQSHVSSLEHGTRRVTSIELFERFADGLGIPRTLLGLAPGGDARGQAASYAAIGANYRSSEVDEAVVASHHEWLAARHLLNQHRRALTAAALRLYPPPARLGRTGVLAPERWHLTAPVDLTAVHLRWQPDAPVPAVTGHHEETKPLRPLATSSRAYSRYHRAMHDLDRPRLFENRLCYRLLDVEPGAAGDRAGLAVTLGNMCYFDMIDVGEALAHETAVAATDSRGAFRPARVSWDRLPFRRLVGDPFCLSTYPLMLSISTLTIRHSSAGSTFYLLRRHPAKVAIAGGMLSVLPTGVFQPASVLLPPASPDFDLWRNVMREYSEEFLGNPEHDGDGPPIDYASTEPFRSLEAARRAGRVRIWCLGIGIDALNYVGDVLTAAVFDADVFDEIFDAMVEHNDEGSVEADRGRQAFAFDGPVIDRLLSAEPLAPSGAACLSLAWQHRDLLCEV